MFYLEREVASSRPVRRLVGVFVFISLAGSIFFVEEMLAPRLPNAVEQDDEAAIKTVFLMTPTSDVPTTTPAPSTATPEPSPTTTHRVFPTLAPPLTATPALLMAVCSDMAQITTPRVGAVLSGQISIYGTATASDFQFYKIEYHRQGEPDDAWHSISDIHRTQVVNGLLDVWDVSGFPAGNYRLKLTVVDVTGNYPPQNRCEVAIVVSQ